jgi:hypothetical protein
LPPAQLLLMLMRDLSPAMSLTVMQWYMYKLITPTMLIIGISKQVPAIFAAIVHLSKHWRFATICPRQPLPCKVTRQHV